MADRDYSGPEKAAILRLALGDDVAPLIFQHLNDQEIQRISNYMSYTRNVGIDIVNEIIVEFAEPEKAEWIISNLSIPTLETGLEALRWLDAKTIARFLHSEHPQTIAVIVAHLDPSQAGTVLTSLPPELQAEVVVRIAKLENIPPGIVQELDKVLRNELKATGAFESGQVGGIQSVAEILNNVDQASERDIMAQIEEVNAALAEEIRQLMFVFEDLLGVDDRGMQQLLKEVSNQELTTALKTASEEMAEKIFRNMSQHAAQMLHEELEVMGPVRVSDVERAQQKITQIAKRLEAEGKLVLDGRGDNAVV
jgi:flagellar motor switch protein FliG